MNTNMTRFGCFSRIFESLCLDESSLSIGRVNPLNAWGYFSKKIIFNFFMFSLLENIWKGYENKNSIKSTSNTYIAKIFENHLNTVILVFIGLLTLSTLR